MYAHQWLASFHLKTAVLSKRALGAGHSVLVLRVGLASAREALSRAFGFFSNARAFWLVGALAACSACDPLADPVPLEEMLQHANGLSVHRPVGFDAVRTTHGFRFKETGTRRYSRHLEVALSPTLPEALTVDRLASMKEVGEGSGGTEYELVAAKRGAQEWIVVRARAQAEYGEPKFSVAQAVLDVSRLRSVDP